MNLLEVDNLKFGYGDDLVLNGISFNVKKGEFLSIIGPNGSGKSTLLKTLNNLYPTKSGEISLEGNNVKSLKKKDLAKKMALVLQDNNIEYDFTVEDIVLMGRHPHKGRFERENADDYKIVDESLEMTNTLDLKDRLVTEISGGERQRVMIAKALAQKPSLILLDEPTSHLDINHQIEILKLLKNMNEELGTTIVLVIHDINLGIRYSDRVIMLNEGKIVEIGNSERVITKDNIKLAYDIDVAIEKNLYTDSLYITPLE